MSLVRVIGRVVRAGKGVRAEAVRVHGWIRFFGAFLVLLAMLSGCAPESADARPAPPFDVFAKPDQPSGVVQDIRESVADWNEKLRPHLGHAVFVFHEQGEPDPDACGTVVVGFGGHLNNGGHGVQATADLRDRCHMSINLNPNGFWNGTIAHELGHTLGLPDIAFDPEVEDDFSIMMQGILGGEILPSDVADVLHRLGLR